ncbi:serine protease, partial [bacterium LRH843]|nr:serine protease [bacterium LRH843]
ESFWNESGQDAGTGSGVIYKKQGNKAFIITNHHVIQGAQQIEVSLYDGSRVPARALGSDELMDSAVIEIDAEHVTKIA